VRCFSDQGKRKEKALPLPLPGKERERVSVVSLSHFPASSFSFKPFFKQENNAKKIVPSVGIESLKLR
jgi:hypothetical protein